MHNKTTLMVQDCTEKYKSAEDAYQAGLFTDCIKMLEEMLDYM